MGEMHTRGIETSSHILGPDGNPVRAAAVTPAEALPAQIDAAAVGTAASPAHGMAPLAAPVPSQAPAAPGMMWVPVSMSGSVMPAGLQLVPTAVPPSTAPAGLVAAEAPQAPVARNEAPTGLRTSEASCGCGVRPAQAAGQLDYLDPIIVGGMQTQAGQMAFPIGQLYYDFGKEAWLDYFVQAIAAWRDGLGTRGTATVRFGPKCSCRAARTVQPPKVPTFRAILLV